MYYDDDDDDDDDYYYYERYYMVISMLDFYKVLRRSAVLCRFPSSLKLALLALGFLTKFPGVTNKKEVDLVQV